MTASLSNSELRLHPKEVFCPQCSLLLFDGVTLNSGSVRQSLKTIPVTAFLRITSVQPHVVRDSVLYLSVWKGKPEKEKKCGVI